MPKMFSQVPNQFAPLRNDLWSIEFPPDMNIPEGYQVEAAKPKLEHNEVEVPYKNITFYYKGKTNTQTISITFREAIGFSVYQQLLLWSRQHTDFATGKGGFPSTYKKNIILNMEADDGTVVQKYIYYGSFITSLDGGDLSMDDDENNQVSFDMRYDTFERKF